MTANNEPPSTTKTSINHDAPPSGFDSSSSDVLNIDELKSSLADFEASLNVNSTGEQHEDPVLRAHSALLVLDYRLDASLSLLDKHFGTLEGAIKNRNASEVAVQLETLGLASAYLKHLHSHICEVDPLLDDLNIRLKDTMLERTSEYLALLENCIKSSSTPQSWTPNIPNDAILVDCGEC